jgi:hypothetical protein
MAIVARFAVCALALVLPASSRGQAPPPASKVFRSFDRVLLLEEKGETSEVMRSLVLSFRTILRTGKIKTLHAWMKKADASGIYRMQRFVRRLKQDQSAVEAAIEQSWSNGQVEGHINRLKTLKTLKPQMYGRAGFELLRARVLPLPPRAIFAPRSEEGPQ